MALRTVGFVAAGLVLAGLGVVSCTAIADAPLRAQGSGAGIAVITAAAPSTDPSPAPAGAAAGAVVTVDPMAGIPSDAASWGPGSGGAAAAAPLPAGVAGNVSRPVITDNRVFMVGDSILLSTSRQYTGSLDEVLKPLGWKYTMDAVVGRSTQDGRRALSKRKSEVHQVAVVFLGNNYDGNQQDFADEVDRILTILKDVPRVLLVTVQESRRQQSEVNDVLWEKAAANPGQVQLVDWATLASTHDDINGPDGLHLNGKGTQLLANLIGQALGPAPSAGA
jgi:hypothetical protein